jgi:hypothetical protein
MPFKPAGTALRDILHPIDLATQFVAGFDHTSFHDDLRTVSAVTRCLEIISEASRRPPDDLKARHPQQRSSRLCAGEAAARRHASTAVSSLACQILAFRAPPGAKHDRWISPFLSIGRPHYAGKARLMLTTKRNSG